MSLTERPDLSFNYVVIGGGAGGAVLARRLAESGRASVALVEAGPADEGRPEVLDLARYREVVEGPLSRRVATLARHERPAPVFFPIARVLGGCTSHNTCIWFRPPPSDFDEWERLGAAGWGAEPMARLFDAVEDRLVIETVDAAAPAQLALLAAAREAGFPEIDFAGLHADGVGRYRLNKRGPLRQSASVAFLHPLAGLPRDLTVLTDTTALRVVFDGDGRAAGVETSRGLIGAAREVVVCAGAFDTPKLLMLSGIGPAEELARFGIPVRHDLPGIGRHLLDHPAAAMNWRAKSRPALPPDWTYAGVVFATLEPSAPWPDIEIQLGPEPFNDYVATAGYPAEEAGFCAYLTVNRARSEGSVRLSSPDPEAEVVVDANHFGDPYDMRMMIEGMRLARRILASPALHSWAGAELAPGAEATSDEALARYIAATHTTGYHPAGTCRIGRAADHTSVVDPDLRVRGVPNLRVADASVFPAMVSVNIQATCMAVGMGCAERILAGL